MNEVRGEESKLSFSSAETQIGYPIEEATEINEQIIISKHQKLLSLLII